MSALATLPLAFSGMALIGLSMDRHARQAGFGTGRASALRLGGWALLALSLIATLSLMDWRFGLVEWVGVIGAGGALVVLTLLYWPNWLPRAAAVAGLAGLMAILLHV